MTALLFDVQRRTCLSCGGPLQQTRIGRPRRYCDADCAREGKRESDRRHMTLSRLAAMRLAKARQTARKNAREGAQQVRGGAIAARGATKDSNQPNDGAK